MVCFPLSIFLLSLLLLFLFKSCCCLDFFFTFSSTFNSRYAFEHGFCLYIFHLCMLPTAIIPRFSFFSQLLDFLCATARSSQRPLLAFSVLWLWEKNVASLLHRGMFCSFHVSIFFWNHYFSLTTFHFASQGIQCALATQHGILA